LWTWIVCSRHCSTFAATCCQLPPRTWRRRAGRTSTGAASRELPANVPSRFPLSPRQQISITFVIIVYCYESREDCCCRSRVVEKSLKYVAFLAREHILIETFVLFSFYGSSFINYCSICFSLIFFYFYPFFMLFF